MSGLEKEFPERVVGLNVDAFSPEGVEAVRALGFDNHGIVIRDPAGSALWKQADHEVDIEAVRGALRDLVDD